MASLDLFPLTTVLFPGGLLPLKIFEQRYLDMAKACLAGDAAFGVCLIRAGREVGEPATPFGVGCSAKIIDWDMPQLGVLHVIARGEQRFRIAHYQANPKGLLQGEVELIDNEPRLDIPDEFVDCANLLKIIVGRVGERHFSPPLSWEDATWVSYRLAEILPIELPARQQLLELTDSRARLAALQSLLRSQGLLQAR